MNIKTDSAFLDPDAQYLGTRPEDHVVLFEQDALCIIEIHFDMGELGSQTFQEVQHSSRYLPLRMDEPEFYALLGLAEICLQEECTCQADGQSMFSLEPSLKSMKVAFFEFTLVIQTYR